MDFSKLEVLLTLAAQAAACRPAQHLTLPAAALQTASLRKYRSVYKLNDVAPSSSKDELIPAVARHFASQVCYVACQAPQASWTPQLTGSLAAGCGQRAGGCDQLLAAPAEADAVALLPTAHEEAESDWQGHEGDGQVTRHLLLEGVWARGE